ncbi:MAG: hypothetical protein WD939_01415 [Dehalococcoidia bacterium]
MLDQAIALFQRNRLGFAVGGVGSALIAIIVVVVLVVSGGNGGDAGSVAGIETPSPVATSLGSTTPGTTGTPQATPTPTPTDEPGGEPAPASAQPPANGAQPTQPPAPTQRPAPTRTPRPRPTNTPEDLSIRIVSPAGAATVSSTFTVRIAVTGIELNLGPGGQLIPGAGHWHLAVDTAPPLPDAHDTATAQVGPLQPGSHTITVLLNLNDADLTVVAIDQVEVAVGP